MKITAGKRPVCASNARPKFLCFIEEKAKIANLVVFLTLIGCILTVHHIIFKYVSLVEELSSVEEIANTYQAPCTPIAQTMK